VEPRQSAFIGHPLDFMREYLDHLISKQQRKHRNPILGPRDVKRLVLGDAADLRFALYPAKPGDVAHRDRELSL
jgi:hypothetical protein